VVYVKMLLLFIPLLHRSTDSCVVMQTGAMKIQQLQSQIDEHNAIIASRNKHGALESCLQQLQQQLQADKDRYRCICGTKT